MDLRDVNAAPLEEGEIPAVGEHPRRDAGDAPGQEPPKTISEGHDESTETAAQLTPAGVPNSPGPSEPSKIIEME